MSTLHDLHPRVPKMNLGPIQEILGEDTPEIHPTPLGRMRLVMALRTKFGPNFRNHPKSVSALKHFDSEHAYFHALRSIQSGGSSDG